MHYLLDTVTVVRHFTDSVEISVNARKLLNVQNDDSDYFHISVISLMEILYLSEKKRIAIDLKETLEEINRSSMYSVIDLTTEIIETASSIDFYELHDRLILATAKWLQVPIISSDEMFSDVPEIEVVWN